MFTVILMRWTAAASSYSNATDLDDDDDDLDEINFEQFKSSIQRYRRLIPYMSYYVSNNYVNSQHQGQSPQSYVEDQTLSPPPMPIGQLLRQSQRAPARPESLRKPARTTTLVKQEKFVPSVQYDPKNIGGDNDYFMPVRYNNKINYEDYYRDYEHGQAPYSETNQNTQDNRYYIKQRPPTIPYNPLYERDQPKQITRLHPDYLVEYLPRPKPSATTQDYYPVDDFESVKYVKIEPPPINYRQQTSRIVPTRRPIYDAQSPLLNEENIVKSLQLTNQLPEMLNRDNIDSSIKTLVEILSLLHGAKKPEPPQRLSDSQNIPSYEQFKQQYTRPKVVTETRYQATPSPHLVAEDAVRFKPIYTNNVKSNTPGYSDYGREKNQNVIQYYTPLIQDIDGEGNVESYPNVKTQKEEPHQENSYEITELVDEQQEEKQHPITTETPAKHYQLAEGFDKAELTIPTMATKYGATRGKPEIDYPTYSSIPKTDFNCKEQRYKGFFGDPSTRCQVSLIEFICIYMEN